MKNKLLVSLVVASGVFASAMAADGLGRTQRGLDPDSAAMIASAATAKDAAKKNVPHTVTWWCVDLTELWHAKVPVIVGPGAVTPPDPSPLPPCPNTSSFPITVPAGSGWISGGAVAWWTNNTYPPAVAEALKSTGYHFVDNSPMEDLMKKVVEVRYVVTTFPDGLPVAEFSFNPRQNFRLVRLREFFGALPVDPIVDPALGIDISADAVGRLPLINFPAVGGGLPPGSYRAQVFWVLSELHNDGLGLTDGNFLPAGEVLMALPRFVVVP